MNRRPNNTGFVLVMVLVSLGLAGVVLASAARWSCQQAFEASNARQRLALKWAVLSCKDVFLPHVEKLLDADSKDSPTPIMGSFRRITVGGIQLEVKACDEQAKINLNMLAARWPDNVDALALELASLQANGVRLQLRAGMPQWPQRSRYPIKFGGYDQLFQYDHPGDLMGTAESPQTPCDYLTCWGSGLVNFRRCPVEVLRIATAGVLDEEKLDKTQKYLREHPAAGLDELTRYLQLSPKQSLQIKEVLTDRSSCHSLWIAAGTKGRSWHRLFVESSGDRSNEGRRFTFAW